MNASERLNRMASGYMDAKILLCAAELRLFDRLDGPGATVAEVAAAIGGTLRGTEILLDALVALGVVRKERGVYTNDPDCGPLLLEDAPGHLVASLRHRNRCFRHWAFLEERITGRPMPDVLDRRGNLDDAQANENFIRAMYAVTNRTAAGVVDRLDLAGVRTVADLGGGPGHYLAEIGRRLPDAALWLIDLPLTLEVARRIQSGTPEGARMRFVAWDFYADRVPDGLPAFDLVFLSQVVHAESADANTALFRKVRDVLAPGGRLVVSERLVDADRTSPPEAALFAVNMLAMTPAGRTYTADEVAGWGRDAGLEVVAMDLDVPASRLVTFRRAT